MKIITAIGNTELNDSLKSINNIEVIGADIPYQEGVLEILETRDDIELVAISNLLPEEMNFLFLIDKIKKIRENLDIVIFLDKENISIENYLNSKNIYKIYYLDENGIEVFLNSLRNRNIASLGISHEIEDLKNIILSKNNIEDFQNNEFFIDSKIIAIAGNPGSGKSIISCILAKQIEKQKKKVAVIDLNLISSIKTILGIDNVEEKEIIISKYLGLYTNIVDEESVINQYQYKLCNIIEEIKKEYDYIIIDTSSNSDFKHINMVLNISDKIVFLLEPNLVEIAKARSYLEIFINDFNIDISKIKIVFNKTNKYQIADSILEEVFSEFEKIGNISYDEKYNSFINQHLSVLDAINLYEIIYEN